MNHTLQKAIMDWLFEHRELFGLKQGATQEFRAYIYDADGQYLIGGARVNGFISKAIELIKEQ